MVADAGDLYLASWSQAKPALCTLHALPDELAPFGATLPCTF